MTFDPKLPTTTPSIGIVGGGPGGLFTAWLLQNQLDQRARITILEASERLGGKVHTRTFERVPLRFEAGAAELYDYSPVGEDPLRELIAGFGLSIVTMEGHAVFAAGRALANQDDVGDHLGANARRAWREFDRRAHDHMSPREFFEAGTEGSRGSRMVSQRFDAFLDALPSPALRAYLETMIHSDLATEPARTSIEYGLQNYLMNDPRYLRLYSIAGGNERLIDALRARLAAEVRLNSCTASIERRPDGQLQVQLATHAPAAPVSHPFDYVILALPLNHLRTLSFPDPVLAQAMQRHIERYDFPAHYLRMTLLFERPYWKRELQESFCMLDSFGGCCLYDESSREPEPVHGILGFLLGGSAAVELNERSDAELIELALEALPFDRKLGAALFLEGRVHRWLDAVNGIPGGLEARTMAQRHQPEPRKHGRLFVVGDYLFDSTLNGVLDSATHVAEWIASEVAFQAAHPSQRS